MRRFKQPCGRRRCSSDYMKNGDFPLDQQTTFSRLVVRLNPLRELRNHIAHGHMLLRVEPNTGRPTITLFKAKDVDMAYSSESRHLEFTELRTALTTLTEVIEDFQASAGFTTT